MVGKRRALLEYLKKTDIESYRNPDCSSWHQKVISLGGVYFSALLRWLLTGAAIFI